MPVSRRARRRLVAVGITLCVVIVGLTSWRLIRRAQLRQLTAEARVTGLAAYEQGNYADALPKLSYSVARNKNDIKVLLAFADTRSRVPDVNNGHVIEAIGLYRAALRIEPANREALGRLLELYVSTGRRPECLEVADRLLALNASDLDALHARSLALHGQGRFDEAVVEVERLIALDPERVEWRALLLEINRAMGASHEQLVGICDEWIDGDQGDGRFHLLKAGVLATFGLTEEARVEGRIAARRGAGSIEVLGTMVEVLVQLQLQEEADQLIETARAEFSDRQKIAEVVVHRLWQLSRIEEALAETEQFAPHEMGAGLLRFQALLLIAGGDVEGSERALDRLAEAFSSADARERGATLAWIDAIRSTRDLDDSTWLAAEQACRAALSLNPQDPALHHALGTTYSHVDEHALAAQSFERATRLDRHWVTPRLAWIRSQLAAGESRDALAGAVELHRQWPDRTAEAKLLLASAWLAATADDRSAVVDLQTRRPIDVVGLLESAYEQSQAAPQVAVLLVEAYVSTGRREAAADVIDEIRVHPDVGVGTLRLLADASARAGLGFESSLAERAREIAGPTPEVIELQAEILRRQGRVDEGLALIDDAFAFDGASPLTPAARRTRAVYLAHAGHPHAVEALAGLLEAEPGSLDTAALVLAQPIAWEDQALIDLALDRLGGIIGEHAPRVILARGAYVLRFEPTDSARLAQAVAQVGALLSRTPDSLPALTLMSSMLLAGDMPDVELSIQYLMRAVDSYPDQRSLYPRLVSLLQQHGNYEAAGEYLQRLRRLPTRPDAVRQNEVGLLAAQGDFETAVMRLTGVVDASSPEAAQLALASLHERAGHYREAEAIHTRLLAAPQRSAAIIAAAADFYARRGQRDEAAALLESPEIAGTPDEGALVLGRFHRKHGDLDAAGRWLQEAVTTKPDSTEAWIELVAYWLEIGNGEEARRAAAAGLQLHPDNGALKAAVDLGGLARLDGLSTEVQLGSDDEARRDCVELYRRATGESGALAPTERDLAAARDLIDDHPRFRPAWHLAIQLYVAAERSDDAVRIARQGVGRFPADPKPAEWAVQLLVRLGRFAEALDLAQTWRQRCLDDPLPADTIIASLYLDLGQPTQALAQLADHEVRVLAERERYPDRLAAWITVLLLNNRFDAAAAIMNPLLSESELWRSRWLTLAAATEADITARALALAEPVAAADPAGALELAGHWLKLANRTGDPAHFARAEELALVAGSAPELALTVLHLRSAIATGRGDMPQAESLCRAVLASAPDDVPALNNLSLILVKLGDRCDEAVTLCTRALQLAPGHAAVLDTCAQAQACTGDLLAAERNARQASSALPDDPEIILTLVGILIAQSEDVEAADLLERVEHGLRGSGSDDPDLRTRIAAMRTTLER